MTASCPDRRVEAVVRVALNRSVSINHVTATGRTGIGRSHRPERILAARDFGAAWCPLWT
jgi:hypothetical protein